MARRDISRTFSEFESEDFSLETSAPTDLSLSPDGDDLSEILGDRKKKISKQLLERKQLLHDLQLVKIELSQKNLMLDNIKADSMQKIEELEEKLSDAVHQKQFLQARLESQLQIQQDEAKTRQEQIQHELEAILQRQQQLEGTNERLQERAVDIRRSLDNLELTENQYHDIKSRDSEDLSLKDYVAVKLYESLKPWKIENADLKMRLRSMSDELYKVKSRSEKISDEYDTLKQKNESLGIKHSKVSIAYADMKSQVQSGDFKIENYDKIKQERDALEIDLADLRKQHAYTDASNQTLVRERDDLSSQLVSNKQAIELLQKDKDYFSKQVNETHNKLLYAEEKGIQLNEQLERAKQAREELYDKYVASRDQYKMEYEAKLRDELELIRARTNTEIDRLKSTSREMYERENRNLREARDMALKDKDRTNSSEKDTLGKYEQLMQDFRHLQISSDNKIADLHNECKIKAFEAERTQMVYEETVRNMKECQLENEKQQKKVEVLTKEFYSLQATLDRRTTELEAALAEKNIKLETYEKLEMELDDVVMQTAEIEDEQEAERVLFSYGYGANVPTTSKRRLKQSVHLARRVLQLEKANTSLRKEVDRGMTKNRQLGEEVKSANKLLDQSQQPYHYLVESVRVRDSQISQQREQILTMEEDISHLEHDRTTLAKAKNQMAEDLEKLLHHKEEMAVMKQVVLSLSQRRTLDPPEKGPRMLRSPRTPLSKTRSKKTTVHRPDALVFDASEENVHKPQPTEFTVTNPPDRYKRLLSKTKLTKSKYGSLQKPSLL